MRAFHFSEDTVLRKLPMKRGWAYYSWAIETDPWMNTRRDGPGYIGQEIQKRIKS
jgi:hypothetical protein